MSLTSFLRWHFVSHLYVINFLSKCLFHFKGTNAWRWVIVKNKTHQAGNLRPVGGKWTSRCSGNSSIFLSRKKKWAFVNVVLRQGVWKMVVEVGEGARSTISDRQTQWHGQTDSDVTELMNTIEEGKEVRKAKRVGLNSWQTQLLSIASVIAELSSLRRT